MKTQVLRGTKSGIAADVATIDGEIHEAIVFVEEPTDSTPPATVDDLFAEMDRLTVYVGDADDSRQAIYTPPAPD